MHKEQEIIKGCVKKNPKYQKALYDYYSEKMFKVCLRYSGDYDAAQDILQDGFIKVFLNIKQFRGKSSLATWMTRVFINTALAYLKKKPKNIISTEDLLLEDIENITDDLPIERDSFFSINPDELFAILQKLPEGYRTILNMYMFENYSHKEIADILNISEGTSKSQLFKAKNCLKSLIVKHQKVNA